jgi:hypothetical protein
MRAPVMRRGRTLRVRHGKARCRRRALMHVTRGARQGTLRVPAWTYVAHAARQGTLRAQMRNVLRMRCACGTARHIARTGGRRVPISELGASNFWKISHN